MVAMRTMWLLALIFVASCAANGSRPEISRSLQQIEINVPASQFGVRLLGNEGSDHVRMKYNRRGAKLEDGLVVNLAMVRDDIVRWLERSDYSSQRHFEECWLEMRVRDAWHILKGYGFFRSAVDIAFDFDSRLICDGEEVFALKQSVRSVSDPFMIWSADDDYYYPQAMFRTFAKGITQFCEAYRSSRSIEEEAEGSEE